MLFLFEGAAPEGGHRCFVGGEIEPAVGEAFCASAFGCGEVGDFAGIFLKVVERPRAFVNRNDFPGEVEVAT